MATLDQARIVEDRARPRAMELWWALRPLNCVVRFMNTGAHPDDETTSMMAALRVRDGFNLSFTCSTRGEGGQNDIGTERAGDLGALRTAEMERAADVLGMRLYWLSESQDDSIVDFGFSKSGSETLMRWGRERTLARFVEVVRTERPDIICPTFLDVPGQHGHHRAMTEMAHLVMSAAADRDFPSALPPWQTRKLCLPAWSGAGRSYDDDEPPPSATFVVSGAGVDPVSGWGWERIGQQSRAFHRSQGMGRWTPAGQERNWPLHLVDGRAGSPDLGLTSGIPVSVADLGRLAGAEPIAGDLCAAARDLEAAKAAFPDFRAVARAATCALDRLRAARIACPDKVREEIVHRLDEKEVQLGHVIRIALGIEVRGRVSCRWLHPGDKVDVELDVYRGDAKYVDAKVDVPEGCRIEADAVQLGANVAATNPYRTGYDPSEPAAPALSVTMATDSTVVSCRLPLDDAPVVMPARQAAVEPDTAIVNLAVKTREIEVALSERHPMAAEPTLDVPAGWICRRTKSGFALMLPNRVAEGIYSLPLLLDGKPTMSVRRMVYPHIGPTVGMSPAEVRIGVLTANVPTVRVGYIGCGNDRVGHWLAMLGADVAEVADEELASENSLKAYDTLVVGIFAMRFRQGLLGAVRRLHGWVESGGTLVTLYHRPWDNWEPGTVPPRRLEIGHPSLRWRVTDETAEVRHLESGHPVLTAPNAIGPRDWDGWHKERGLYFAKSWDEAYRPLVEMSDPGESPHRGALLAADIGLGRHVHTSLILHHQMEKLVPGAFRLMANMIVSRSCANSEY
ncbi:MAG: PIG-L family deacetylase [Rhodobacteraceae bacterium]|nr:PIG-L family deacetylase [Paracoccaceae bacterium]